MAINSIMPQTTSANMSAVKEQNLENKNQTMTQNNDEIAEIKNNYVDTFEKSSGSSDLDFYGIYHLSKDENGIPKILFGGDMSSTTSETTTNTDKVDAEIEKLNQKKQEIERQLQAEKDLDKRAELQHQLQSIELELKIKDNDIYRQQNATYN